MNKTIRLDIALLALLLIAVVLSQYFSDPGGSSRRNPTSMHAHQADWPATCHDHSAQKQSPILITSLDFKNKNASALKSDFKVETGDLIDVGHSFQVRLPKPSSTVSFEGNTYLLKQFHFHKPAEHIIDGKQYNMEIHFVLSRESVTQAQPKALVLGFMVDEGDDQTELAKVWRYLPPFREGFGESPSDDLHWENSMDMNELDVTTASHNEKNLKQGVSIDLSRLIPKSSNFYVYDGSLTTPPCDEGITHAVSTVPIKMSHEQMEHFEGYYEGNNRDIQPIGNVSLRNFRKGTIN